MCCRKRLLLRAAHCLHYDKVAVGDISSKLAGHILSFIAQGRGAQLPHEVVSATLVISYCCSAMILRIECMIYQALVCFLLIF